MRINRIGTALLGPLMWTVAASAEVSGRVTTVDGAPIESARVQAGAEVVRFTDLEGRFVFRDLSPPATLLVSHARFLPESLEVSRAATVEVQLRPKQDFFEEIAVSANRGDASYAPSSVASSVLRSEDLAAPPATLADLVVSAPAVSENGQGGIFQTYSIRGIARLRVLTLLSGMRIIGERRAGVSASFVDAGLLGNVDVIRGPSSTYYGSGALGGVIQMFPRVFSGPTIELGLESQGDGANALVGWGDKDWSFGLAHRRSSEGETPSNAVLNDGFDQTSFTLSRQWGAGDRRYSLLAIGSRGVDIGKSNSDFPNRVTVYPEETHALLRFAARDASGWTLEAWAHPNELQTRVMRDGNQTDTDNDSFDFGLDWQRRRQWGEHSSTRYGVEYFGRQNVRAREVIQPLEGRAGPVIFQTPLDGSENELGLYGAYERNWDGVVLLLGGRFAAQGQSSEGESSRQDTALSGFAGVVVPLDGGFEFTANLGSGLRFPSLSERYFSGITPRGNVTGNAELETERSLSIDAGMRYYGSRLYFTGGVFLNAISDYIERIEVTDDELTFANLEEGEIQGVELEAVYSATPEWSVGLGGHMIEGRSDAGMPLADVPPDRLHWSNTWKRGSWRAAQRWEHRFAKSDPGSGESVIPAVDLLSLSLSYDLGNGVVLSVTGRNLLDESYFVSADDKAEIARGRSIGLSFSWQGS